MPEKEPRLGDVIDDYCSRCRLLMNHGVVGLVGTEVKRVRCNTCMSEHAYRHARLPKKKGSVQDLFDQVLSRIPQGPATPPAPPAAARRRTPHLGMRPYPPPAEDPQADAKPRRRGKRRGKRKPPR